MVLFVDDTLLASSDTGLLHKTKHILFKTFGMKEPGEVSFVLGIEFTDRYLDMLRYLKEPILLKRFNPNGCGLSDGPIVKWDKLSKFQLEEWS